MKRFLIPGLLFTLFIVGCAEEPIEVFQKGSLEVTVVDVSNNALINVEVTTSPSTDVKFTNDSGRVVFSEINVGSYAVTAKLTGYIREVNSVSVDADRTSTVKVVMTRDQQGTPNAVRNPIPANESTDLDRTVTLAWEIEKGENDTIIYDLQLFEATSGTPLIEAINLTDTFFVAEGLQFNSTYFWQVISKNLLNEKTNGPFWSFSTSPLPLNRIIYSSETKGVYQIFSTNQTGDSVQITRDQYQKFHPIYSKDRSEIAYTSNREIDYHIYISDNTGDTFKKITDVPVASFHYNGGGYSWSPDNGRFAYSHYDRLYTIRRDGSDLTRILNAPDDRNFRDIDWTSNGNRLVVETVGSRPYDGEIYLMNANGSDTVRIFDNAPGTVGSPTFSIDGKQVMFTWDVSGYEVNDGRMLDSHILIYDIASQDTVDISDGSKPDGTNDLYPRFSPDGSTLIFSNQINDRSQPPVLFIMSTDGSGRERVVSNGREPFWK
jgi:TolB protein